LSYLDHLTQDDLDRRIGSRNLSHEEPETYTRIEIGSRVSHAGQYWTVTKVEKAYNSVELIGRELLNEGDYYTEPVYGSVMVVRVPHDRLCEEQ